MKPKPEPGGCSCDVTRLREINVALVEALREARSLLVACYDPTEDNRHNPTMQDIGKALDQSQHALALAKGEPTNVKP